MKLKFNADDLSNEIKERLLLGDEDTHKILNACLTGRIPGMKVHREAEGVYTTLADDGNRIAGSPGYHQPYPKNPGKDVGGQPQFANGGKKYDWSDSDDVEAAFADGTLTTEQYRRCRKAIKQAAVDNGPQNVGSESDEDDDSRYAETDVEADEADESDELDETDADEYDSDSDDEDEDSDEDEISVRPEPVARKRTSRADALFFDRQVCDGMRSIGARTKTRAARAARFNGLIEIGTSPRLAAEIVGV